MIHPSELTARDAAKAIENGELTSEKLVRACIERIDARDSELHAWAYFNRDQALDAAKASDRAGNKGPLGGIPVGVKDIIDTYDMPTEYGSPIYKGNQPTSDATCVSLTRRAGGLVLGKTATTEFAHQFPAKTRNPHNVNHTPGGSSSGSGAATASFMVPLAFGTQTGGSTIRPAAFCGVVGYKPTYGEFGLKGVKENAQCCDTVGLHARSVDDIALFRAALLGLKTPPLAAAPLSGLRIGFCRTKLWDKADAVTQRFLEDSAAQLSKNGATVTDYDMSDDIARVAALGKTARSYELHRALLFELTYHFDQVSEMCREGRPKDGAAVTPDQYRDALAGMAHCRDAFTRAMTDFDVLITPSAPGEAPNSLATTGSSVFNDLWTALHVPCLTMPALSGPNGLPIGLQVVGHHAKDQRLLEASQAVSQTLAAYRQAA